MPPSILALSLTVVSVAPMTPCATQAKWTLLVHGGAGQWPGPQERRARAEDVLRSALSVGSEMLAQGAGAMDTVVEVIARLEDAPEMNAGRGGKPNREGFVELDAALMRGSDRAAGAVGGVRDVRNPIRLARAVMEHSPHVFFVDRGASAFARRHGLEIVDPRWFLVVPPASEKVGTKSKAGTVGAVALDRCGETVAGTSTGGYDTKIPGRIGDVPVIGAGTYADPTVAVSATGWGEWFIRFAAGHEVSAQMRYAKVNLADALQTTLDAIKAPHGATGGLIALTPNGLWATAHTSPGMLRGIATHTSTSPKVGIFDTLR